MTGGLGLDAGSINGWWPTTGYSERVESRINPPRMTTNEDEYDMNMDSGMVI